MQPIRTTNSPAAVIKRPWHMRQLVRLIASIGGLSLLFVSFLIFATYQSRSIPKVSDIDPTVPGWSDWDHKDPPSFNLPTASVQHSVIRGDLIAWTNDKETVWQSVGRHPNRAQCWTFEDRFGPYKSLSAEATSLISNNNKRRSTNKRAIVLRLGGNQAWNSQFKLHVRALVLEAGYSGGYDVFIYIHLDLEGEKKSEWLERIPQEFLPLVKTFSTKDLRNWLPKKAAPMFENVFKHNHVPIQKFMADNLQYEFVYSIENDVRLIGRWDEFLADVDAEYAFHRKHQREDQDLSSIPDLVTFESVRRPRKDWPWLKSADKCIKHFGGKENIRSSLGVMWGWSRRLIDTLKRYNEEGINCYYEFFAPSAAYRENLTTFFYQHPLYCPNRPSPSERINLVEEDLGKNDPKLVQFNKVAVGCTTAGISASGQGRQVQLTPHVWTPIKLA
ncbi:hypothetical protein TWF281_005566 [Arthrobotrys megalospora]